MTACLVWSWLLIFGEEKIKPDKKKKHKQYSPETEAGSHIVPVSVRVNNILSKVMNEEIEEELKK